MKNIKNAEKIVPPQQTRAPQTIDEKRISRDALETDQPIPLNVYLQRDASVGRASNFWHGKTVQWTKLYLKLAREQMDVRNFSLSQALSRRALDWAKRSEIIKDLTQDQAQIKIETWLTEDGVPDLPPTNPYYKAVTAFNSLQQTHQRLMYLKQYPACSIHERFPLVSSAAYFELALSHYAQKKYEKSFVQSQLALAPILVIDMTKPMCENKP